jgi:Uma2 family endonuclease
VSSPVPTRFTAAEYLALERASDRKHEFVDGMIVAMAGARLPHNVLTANITSALVQLAKRGGGGCVTMSSDQRVHVPSTGLYAYPDVTVAGGERNYDANEPPSLLNPSLLVEVTSESTEDYDRGSKFLHYQAITSLREYVIVSHREQRIDVFRRLATGQWLGTAKTGTGTLDLEVLSGSLDLAEIYSGVGLDEGSRR